MSRNEFCQAARSAKVSRPDNGKAGKGDNGGKRGKPQDAAPTSEYISGCEAYQNAEYLEHHKAFKPGSIIFHDVQNFISKIQQ